MIAFSVLANRGLPVAPACALATSHSIFVCNSDNPSPAQYKIILFNSDYGSQLESGLHRSSPRCYLHRYRFHARTTTMRAHARDYLHNIFRYIPVHTQGMKELLPRCNCIARTLAYRRYWRASVCLVPISVSDYVVQHTAHSQI